MQICNEDPADHTIIYSTTQAVNENVPTVVICIIGLQSYFVCFYSCAITTASILMIFLLYELMYREPAKTGKGQVEREDACGFVT